MRALQGLIRRHRAKLGLLAALVAAATAVPTLIGFADPDARAHSGGAGAPAALSATVTVSPAATVARVPRSFLGLSTEYWTVPIWSRQSALLERVMALVHASGDGPLVLRIGGDSADHSFWEPTGHELPDWVFPLTPSWLREVRSLVHQTGIRLILDLNLVTATPALAAQWAGAAIAALPRGSIVGLEIGNEPDVYTHAGWLAVLGGPASSRAPLPESISSSSYVEAFQDYAAALGRVGAGLPLMGPALANPQRHLDWVQALLRARHPGLSVITAHRYPYSACAFPGTRAFPTVPRVLSQAASAGVARSLEPLVKAAHAAGMAFRLSELNSVTCGGRAGVSDTFATALWAPDALFELLQAGVDAVNVHVRAHTINAAFALTQSGLVARPLLYGLIAFVRTLGPDARLVAVHVSAPPGAHLKAWAVRVSSHTLHVLLIDKGARSVRVWLRVPASGAAVVQRLLAPSAYASGGVTLGGRWLNAAGQWVGSPALETVHRTAGGYRLIVSRTSAALLSLQLPHPATRGRAAAHRPPAYAAPRAAALSWKNPTPRRIRTAPRSA